MITAGSGIVNQVLFPYTRFCLFWDLIIFHEGGEISEQNVKNQIWTDLSDFLSDLRKQTADRQDIERMKGFMESKV